MSQPKYQAKERYQLRSVADSYDDRRFVSLKGRWTDRREKSCVLKALERANPAGPILDIPCGTGRMTELLLERGFRVIGGDISEAMIKHAVRRTAKYGERVQFVKCDIESLQFPPGSFDLVLTVRLLHHIPPSLHKGILAQLHRVTRRWVIISFSNKYTLQNWRRNLKSLFTGFPRYAIAPSLFRKEVAEAGFNIVEYIPLLPVISESVFVLLEKR